MDNLVYKYNRFLITIFTFTPFVAYFTVSYMDMEFEFIMQLMSYFGVALLIIFRDNTNPLKFPKYLIFYFLFILYIFYQTFFQLDRDFKIKYLIQLQLIGGFNLMFIIENISITKKQFRFILSVSKKILIVAILVIIYQQVIDPAFLLRMDFGEIDEVISWGSTQNRLLSIYSWIMGYLPIGFSFVPIFLLIVEDLDKKKKEILIWVIAGFIFAFLSKARWIMLNTLLVFFLLFINHKNKKQQLIKLLFFVPLFYIGSIFLLESIGVEATHIVNERILEKDTRYNQTTGSTRLLAFEAFNKLYWDQPFFGKGDIKYGMGGTGKHDYKLQRFLAGRSAQIHVGYLALLYNHGLMGGLFFLTFLYLLMNKLYKNAKKTKKWAPFLGLFGFVLANMTLVTFSVFQMGLIIALVADRFYNQNLIEKVNE